MDGGEYCWRLHQLQQKLNLKGPTRPSPSRISKVPNKLRSVKKEAYSPLMVSIGPYHHGNLELPPMEDHKLHCMRNLLRQVENPEETLHDCIKAIKNLEQRVGDCYAEKIRVEATELGEILLVDGCFIIDLFYRHTILQGDALADPTLRHDLVLLENQIPFFILVELNSIFQPRLMKRPADYSLVTSLALSFFYPGDQYVNWREGIEMSREYWEPNHLLHLLHQSWLPTPGKYPSHDDLFPQSTESTTRAFRASASELLEAGFQFEKINYESHLLNIRFDRGYGVIKIPTLFIDETESLLRSFISLEQCGFNINDSSCESFHVSSYALLLKSLIRSSADVQLLQEKGIIISDLEKGGTTVLAIISDICNNIHVKHFYFADLCNEVNTYYKSRLYRMWKEDWMLPVKVKLGILRERSMSLSIYKVPNKLRNVKDEAYSPRIVSIGPFHKGKRDLLAMEEHKWRYMLSLVHRRISDPEKSLDECGQAIIKLEEQARGCYAENITFNENELAETLLVDGCFIVELFLRHSLRDFVDESDPIFNNAWMIPALQHDLALLENQIPFYVLEKLFEIVLPFVPKTLPPSFTALALSFFHPDLIMGESIQSSRHLLDLLHKFYLPTSRLTNPKGKDNWGFRHCATTLLEAGIHFQKSTGLEDRLLDVRYSNGVITIPPLSVGSTTESLLRNLIALEQCSFGSTHHITSYAFLINGLIRSSADIELLQRRGIIINNLGRGEEILPIFNNIGKEVVLKDFCFSKLCEDVNVYRKSWWRWQRHKAFWKARWRRYVAALRQDYFSNPWRIISFVAAVVLLLLTGLQTFYSVLGYYPH